ncbi:unnamed protein product [Rotaria magnacalcarata]|uniref:Uncharacterized protein n=1 Tax=Rotaria magnacalcarata TaxID=392030 RepID=A0A816YXY9_9BILA|nr:unnamed protein product [Rotaria magnacalcarata]
MWYPQENISISKYILLWNFSLPIVIFFVQVVKRTKHKIIKRKKHFFSETTLQLFCFIQVATVNVLRD